MQRGKQEGRLMDSRCEPLHAGRREEQCPPDTHSHTCGAREKNRGKTNNAQEEQEVIAVRS